MSTGEVLRDEGMATVLGHTPTTYRAAFTAAYEAIVHDGQPFTSEDILAVVGMPPNHHNTVGALMSSLLRRDLRTGRVLYVKHTHKTIAKGHAAMIGQYVGNLTGDLT